MNILSAYISRTPALFLLVVGAIHGGSLTSKGAHAKAPAPKAAAAVPAARTPADSPTLLQFSLRIFLEDYERVGRKDAKWDAAAKKALDSYARANARVADADDDPNARLEYLDPLNEAMRAGCTDPLVRYLKLRAAYPGTTTTKSLEIAALYRSVSEDMAASGYSDYQKFYAAARAAEALNSAKTNAATPPEVLQLRLNAANHLRTVVRDPKTPVDALVDPCVLLMEITRRNSSQFQSYYRGLEPILFRNWPSSHVPLLIEGIFNTKWAWVARGGGYADTVTEQGWKLFEERLDLAEKSLEKAWAMNPKDERIALAMMTVEMGQGKHKERMELWFKRAMDINPNSYTACSRKMLYLEPKWFGSPEEMIRFGRECVESKDWGGSVPQVLAHAHANLSKYLETPEQQAEYWRQPEVWSDVKASWEKLGKLKPNHQTWRQYLARDAFRCGKFDEFNSLIEDEKVINYTIFGGKAEFEKMRGIAEASTKGK